MCASAGEPLAQHVLPLLGALAARILRPPEEVGELVVAVPLGVLGVGLEPQDVREALLGEPDDVVVLVLRAGDLAGLGLAGRHRENSFRRGNVTGSGYPGTRDSLNREQLDFALDPWCAGQPRVAGEQERVKRLCEGDVGGVVGAEVVAQLPDPRHERTVRGPLQRHPGKVGESHLRAPGGQATGAGEAAPRRDDLDLHHRRGGQTLSRQTGAKTIAGGVLADERRGDDRRVYDYHPRASRSARTYSTASCSDMPSSAARRFRTRCTSGGTFLIWMLGMIVLQGSATLAPMHANWRQAHSTSLTSKPSIPLTSTAPSRA